eukprot:14301717-Alexandrium_andersonii.AAC.1
MPEHTHASKHYKCCPLRFAHTLEVPRMLPIPFRSHSGCALARALPPGLVSLKIWRRLGKPCQTRRALVQCGSLLRDAWNLQAFAHRRLRGIRSGAGLLDDGRGQDNANVWSLRPRVRHG